MMGRDWGRSLRLSAVVMVVLIGARATYAQQPPAGQKPPAPAPAPMPPGMKMPADLGIVSGTVTKASGGPVAGATVTAINATNGTQYSATTDEEGRYTLPSLPAGTYDITAVLGGFRTSRQSGISVTANSVLQVNARLEAGDADTERQGLLDRIEQLEKRLGDLESSAVLSEPETRVRRVEVYVDQNGNEFDQPTPGAERRVTYQRERVYRRQTISEKIEEAMSAAADQAVRVGVDATTVLQGASLTEGDKDIRVDNNAYALASADLFFTAKLAQYTTFFADVVALSGSPPDAEIPSLTLLNGYTARLVNPNQLNLREVWLRTELFGQRLALTAGRLDLTNYFDRNAGANDETTQFISDALVNNQMLGLASNGTGFIADYDPKNGLSFRVGVQQSNDDATNLSDFLYSLFEVGYTATPFSLPEGNYRVWFRANNGEVESKHAFGLSIDQKLTSRVILFARYGQQDIPDDKDHFWSGGFSFGSGLAFNPLDTWGIGYAETDFHTGDKERLAEGYYNFQLTERLRLSFSLQHVITTPGSDSKFGYLLPGVRLQAAF
ncbi:MAG TPA: carboxypeptidase regulatory-like domain-containing protein [Vicinamibacterales bacterium]|nr:carboxypeptidase regulatory-like domain-containing protein [Vicinamibacterales bacterium]